MATDIDWISRLRAEPSEVCPPAEELRSFAELPEGVSAQAFSHIIGGCPECQSKLQELVLHPPAERLEEYLRYPSRIDEDTVLHCMSCEICKKRIRGILDA